MANAHWFVYSRFGHASSCLNPQRRNALCLYKTGNPNSRYIYNSVGFGIAYPRLEGDARA
jgi:hypothetical protein